MKVLWPYCHDTLRDTYLKLNFSSNLHTSINVSTHIRTWEPFVNDTDTVT